MANTMPVNCAICFSSRPKASHHCNHGIQVHDIQVQGLIQPLRLVFSFDHLTNALFGPSRSLNAPFLADPRCRRFSAPDHTQTLLPILPFQHPPALLRAHSPLDLRIRNGPTLRPTMAMGQMRESNSSQDLWQAEPTPRTLKRI
jgi:hypothetical protein